MSVWNYRVMKDGELFGIHEVYYDEDGKPEAYTNGPVAAAGDTVEELKEDLKMQLAALEAPVVRKEDIPG